MEEEVKGINDYLDILKRHKKLVIIPALLLMLVAAAVALMLPATYKSGGIILIESQEIPSDLVRSTVTSYADQRIAVIKQKLLTTVKVMSIIKKYNLYLEERKKSPPSVLVAMFRENMFVDMINANVTDPRSGRSRRASIAFKVSFMSESPARAQQVANELVTEFLNENVKTRTARARETKAFLKEEADKFQQKIQSLEEEIANFKDKHSDSLPEILPHNLSMVQSLQKELAEGQNQIMVLKDQIMTMSLELTNLDKFLPSLGSNQPTSLAQKIALAKDQYVVLQGKYSENHPDIKRIKRQIEKLESQSQVQSTDSGKAPEANQYKSALLLRINSKINSSEREVSRLYRRKALLRKKLNDYEKRVETTHQVKRAYNNLVRDYDNNMAKYHELRAKELQAALAQNLESENKGESFTLIEPPQVPNKPEKPNRPKIFVMGAMAAIAVGVGLALLFDMLIGGIRGYSSIGRILGSSPLVVVPVLTTTKDLTKKPVTRYKAIYILVVLAILAVAGFHFLVMDLEIFWFKLLRKISFL